MQNLFEYIKIVLASYRTFRNLSGCFPLNNLAESYLSQHDKMVQ
jgi:hypothetical protein